MAVNINIPDAWTSYVTQTNLGLEVVPSVLYDQYLLVAGANPAELRFFQSSATTLDVTNMKTPGALPNPEAFLIQNMRINFKTLTYTLPTVSDGIIDMLDKSVGILEIGNKRYGPWPLWVLGAGNMFTNSFGGQSATTPTFYSQISGPLYPLFPNLMLSPLQPFVFTIRTTPPAPSIVVPTTQPNGFSVQVLFDGQLARAIQ